MHIAEAEQDYRESLREPLNEAERMGQADIVIGIPFQNEVDTIGHVCKTVAKGLSEFFPDKRCVILCIGAPEGGEALNAIQEVPLGRGIKRIAFLMKNKGIEVNALSLRAIMEITDKLNADLALFEADLQSREMKASIEGLTPEWVGRLLVPIEKEGIGLVIPRFNSHYLDSSVSNHLLRPLLASIFNLKTAGLPGKILGISSKLLRIYLADHKIGGKEVNEYSLDSYFITIAIINEVKICETSLGVKINKAYPDKEGMWRQQTKLIFEQIADSKDWWQQKGDMIYPLATFGEIRSNYPGEMSPDPLAMERFKQGFVEFQGLYEEILSRKASRNLRMLAGIGQKAFKFSSQLWTEIVYDFLLFYCLEQGFAKEIIINAFVKICYAREAGFALELQAFQQGAGATIQNQIDHLTTLVAEHEIQKQVDEFIKQKIGFLKAWRSKDDAIKPLLPMATYREFIPGFPLILPKELVSPNAELVSTDDIYNNIIRKCNTEFKEFYHKRLKLSPQASSTIVAEGIENLMRRGEQDIDEIFLSGDLLTLDGTKKVVEAVLHSFPHSETFTLKPEVASWILHQNPPTNLLIRLGVSSLVDLEKTQDPKSILGLSSLSEEAEHTERVWEWIANNARPEHFDRLPLEPLVVSNEDLHALVFLKEPSALSKLAGRLIVSNLRSVEYGGFPKLRYLLTICKNIVEAERFGEIWEQFARERKEFGTRVINSLKGHWGREPLSAHNMFENKIHRILVERFREMIRDLEMKGNHSLSRLTQSLGHIMDCYHLALSLPDGGFVPCSAWTWSSYSYKGGKGVPTPLSLHVERDWLSREFLVELFKAQGGSEEIMDSRIVELMGHGMESENLARLILPGWQTVRDVLPEQITRPVEPKAKELRRFEENPILKAIAEHPWESKYVFNPTAIMLKGKVYILYRACGEDEVSRIGLAISEDGYHIKERLESPIFEPLEEWETKGCEDPRIVLIKERIYMFYTAYSSIAAQLALASIGLNDFFDRRWNKWRRHGLAFPGFDDKDATLFPQAFNGQYVMYHRIEPSIWISKSDQLGCPWPRDDHRILVGPGAGMVWDGLKIGCGSQPIKTKYGWLLIYHGVDQSFVYRLGVLLVALNDPGQLLYRSPNPVLEPKERYELGEEGCYVPNVVFSCGAVSQTDKEMLSDDDEVLVYYGAADTVACVASAKLSDLIPEEIRQGRNHNSYRL
ncbi:glycosidase [Chloroflexota bacterium]